MRYSIWFVRLVPVVLLAGCSLYSDVSIQPLMLNPMQIDRGSDIESMVRKSDYLRALEMMQTIDNRQRKSVADLQALGNAELAAGRFDEARRHLRAAIDIGTTRDTLAHLEWSLSQLEYLANNYAASLDWAEAATSHGLLVRQWHLDYLTALSGVQIYRASGLPSSQLALHSSHPDVPRIDLRLNGHKTINAVIDTGAVISIASKRLADEMSIRRLPNVRGTFYGLLGEPITVEFGLLDSVTVGDIVVENVPIAIMPDDKMRFVVAGRREFKMDFLLGANFLKEFRTDLDFAHNVVTFTRLTAADRHPAPDQNLFVQGFRPFVRGTINGHGWYVFVLDTGSEITFLNEKQIASLPITQLAPRMHSALLQGLGGSQKRGGRVDDVEIGVDRWAGKFHSVPMYTAGEQENAAGIIGENYLKKFRVIIDYGRMRVDLVRGSHVVTPPPNAMTAIVR